MTQMLRALAALQENPDSIPSTHMVAHNNGTPVPRDLKPPGHEGTRHACGTQTYMKAKPLIYIKGMFHNGSN